MRRVTVASTLLASIPSPHNGTVDLGPLTIHLYGLTLLVAIGVCIWITGRRWVARGGGWDLIYRCALWGVGAGIVGARLYHLATSWNEVPDPKWRGAFEIWHGGLGVWGGIAAGVVVGGMVARRSGVDVAVLMDCVAPALLVAQGIGRLGNWWNQELYGKPTKLPWGLEIDAAHRVAPYFDPSTTFHPTFLYELIWDLLAAGLLILIARRFTIRPPGVFALYVSLYCFGRFWIEALRVDPAHHIAGLRLNDWVALLGILVGLAWFVHTQRDRRPRRRRPLRPRRKQAPPAPVQTMAVPRGRVRRGR
jgi:prolipoprotein diacylglyceryl transferase